MILSEPTVSIDELEARTGWAVKPEGACLGDVCVPLPAEARRGDGRIDADALADRLGMPLLTDEAHGLWSLGPATATGKALATAVAPEVELPRYPDGTAFRLSSLRGTKVVMVAWASW